jgi:tRNA dimethylallyltransferase
MGSSASEIIVIGGPTASGKSAWALELARRLNGEIISADSMQVYRGLEIGTAQPTPEEQQEIPHHLVGCFELTQRWDASRFVPVAEKLIAQIRERGRVPIVVGGTGMYLKALCYGMAMLPSDPLIAQEMRALLLTPEGIASLRDELRRGVGEAEIPADLWANPRRVARAVEVLRITGKPPWLLQPAKLAPRDGFRQFCIIPNFDWLKERIRRRTACMLEAGWVEEALCAVHNGLLETPTAWQALGYRDIAEFTQHGSIGGQDALAELLANRTIQYARRQITWFKHQHPGATLVDETHSTDLA